MRSNLEIPMTLDSYGLGGADRTRAGRRGLYVYNVHSRELAVPAERVGALLDGLASPGDRLWPHESWPRMRFDRPLGVGAAGGHGPIRYSVEDYRPGSHVRFRFNAPRGFDGTHGYDVETVDATHATLTHSLVMRAHGEARLLWPLVWRPLHDALIEDSLTKAERELGLTATTMAWSAQVRLLRGLLGSRERRSLKSR